MENMRSHGASFSWPWLSKNISSLDENRRETLQFCSPPVGSFWPCFWKIWKTAAKCRDWQTINDCVSDGGFCAGVRTRAPLKPSRARISNVRSVSLLAQLWDLAGKQDIFYDNLKDLLALISFVMTHNWHAGYIDIVSRILQTYPHHWWSSPFVISSGAGEGNEKWWYRRCPFNVHHAHNANVHRRDRSFPRSPRASPSEWKGCSEQASSGVQQD